MRFTRVEDIPERDSHLLAQWASDSGMVLICVERIIGAVRVQFWYERPDAMWPDILQGTWDTPPDGRLVEIIDGLMDAFKDFPELATQREVQSRILIHMYEQYGDIYDGMKARPIDRDHPDHNPRANPWWNDAQVLREQLDTGVYRHHLPLNLDAPALGDVWAPPEPAPQDKGEADYLDTLTPMEAAAFLEHKQQVEAGVRDENDSWRELEDPEPEEGANWREEAWEQPEREPTRPNPSWSGPPKPHGGPFPFWKE
jgi:hypothetical protein